MTMTQLWYPGRPPFCSNDLMYCLTHAVECLFEVIAEKQALPLEVLDQVVAEALYLIEKESDDCLGTDKTLNKLRELFENSLKIAHLLYQNNAWPDLIELATNLLVVRNELAEHVKKIEGDADACISQTPNR